MTVTVPMSGINVNIEYIDKYKIVGILGLGGQNCVLDAVDMHTQIPCAVKVLFGFGRDPEAYVRGVRWLRNEGKAYKEVGFHDNILKFLDEGDLKIEPAVQRDLIRIPCYFNALEKVILYHIPHDKGFPIVFSPQQAAGIGAEAAYALIQFHSAGWMHRDVKPQNLFIDEERHVHLGDLGLACLKGGFSIGQENGCGVGTPEYVSPEQAIGREAMPESDIYSLGVSLYAMISGVHPFRGEDIMETIMNGRRVIATPLREGMKLPRRLNNVVEKMMEKMPENRGDLREIKEELTKASTEHNEFH